MGWTWTAGRGTHAEIDATLMRPRTNESNGLVVTHTDCKLVNLNHHWWVLRHNGEPIEILLALIGRAGSEKSRDPWLGDGPSWGYKDICETMGPAEVDCPLSLLDLVPEPPGSDQGSIWAREWRQRVRDYHTQRQRLNGIHPGDRIKLVDNVKPAQYGGQWFTVDSMDHGRIHVAGFSFIPRSIIAEVEHT